MTREIRNGIVVYSATGSEVAFKTQVRRTKPAAAASRKTPSTPAIECRVTYAARRRPARGPRPRPKCPAPAARRSPLVSGLDSSNVFNYEPSPPKTPTYVGITLHIENPEGQGELTVTDGAGLRIQSYLAR